LTERRYRQPTIEEAVECITRISNSRATRNQQLDYLREQYGDQYADEIKAKATVILMKRKGKK